MAIRSKEFVGIAEGIKSHELSTKGRIESLRGTISELSGAKRSLESQISYLEAALAAAYEDTDEDGDPDYGRISAIEAQISQAEGQLSEVEGELDDAHGELTKSEAELDGVMEEKARTLFEIQERARKTSNNIAVAGGMYGAYSGVGSSLQSSMQTSLASLSQAASILDGSVDGFTGGGSGGGGGGSSTGGRGMTSQGELSTSALSAFAVGAATSSILSGNTSPASAPSSFTTNHTNGATPATTSGFRSGQQSINPQKTLNFNSEQSGNSYAVSAFSDNDGSEVASKPSSKPSDYRSSQTPSNMESRLSSDSKAPGGASKMFRELNKLTMTPEEVAKYNAEHGITDSPTKRPAGGVERVRERGGSDDPRWDDSSDVSAKAKPARTARPTIVAGNSYNLSKSETEYIRKTITHPHCEIARGITQIAKVGGIKGAASDDMGKNFTSHNEDHLEQVRAKTSEALAAMVNTLNFGSIERDGATGDVHFDEHVDFRVAQAAAEAHDTGMSNHGYVFDCDEKKIPKRDINGNIIVLKQNSLDFNSIRSNHSANSALNVLRARESYKAIGFTDAQVDEIAVLVYAHSKSNSGVTDLNNSKSWSDCFDRIEALKNKFNADHPNNKVSFTRSRFEGASNARKLGSLATEALALRVGDVSRNSGPDALAQSGEIVHVEKSSVNSSGNSWKDEIEGAVIMRANVPVTHDLSRRIHIGEQNIVDNHTEFKNGALTHTITINDGSYAPHCTAEAIVDHIGELASAKNGHFVVELKFNSSCDKMEQYEDFRTEMKNARNKDGSKKYGNVEIKLPWD